MNTNIWNTTCIVYFLSSTLQIVIDLLHDDTDIRYMWDTVNEGLCGLAILFDPRLINPLSICDRLNCVGFTNTGVQWPIHLCVLPVGISYTASAWSRHAARWGCEHRSWLIHAHCDGRLTINAILARGYSYIHYYVTDINYPNCWYIIQCYVTEVQDWQDYMTTNLDLHETYVLTAGFFFTTNRHYSMCSAMCIYGLAQDCSNSNGVTAVLH